MKIIPIRLGDAEAAMLKSLAIKDKRFRDLSSYVSDLISTAYDQTVRKSR